VPQTVVVHLYRWPEEPEEDEELAEDKATFLDTLKGIEAAKKHTCQFHVEDNITVMCNKMEQTENSRKK
jgi:hypothetical protein